MTDVSGRNTADGRLRDLVSAEERAVVPAQPKRQALAEDLGNNALGFVNGLIKRTLSAGKKRRKKSYTVTFEDVSKVFRNPAGTKWVLRDVSFQVPRGKSLAILGKNGVGKSSLMKLIAGVIPPTRGDITRMARISWPLGMASGFSAPTSARDNCNFVSRIYGADVDEVTEFVREFSELGAYFDAPVKSYSPGMRARLAFGLSMAIDFDCYLIDEATSVGDKRFREKCEEVFALRRKKSDVIMISHNEETLRAYCDIAAVLNNGKLRFFDDMDEAFALYKRL